VAETILVVDDEQDVRHILHKIFEGKGYTVLEAESGEQALEMAGGISPDMVLTDLKMPGMDGLSLAQRFLEQDPDRPALLMTGYADMESARRAVKVGVYEYFTKPFDVNDVLAGVGRALERRRLVLENRAYQKDLERRVAERTAELRRAYAGLERKVRELEGRNDLLQYLLAFHPLEDALERVVSVTAGVLSCEAVVVHLPDPDGGCLRPAACIGVFGPGATASQGDLAGVSHVSIEQACGAAWEQLAAGPVAVQHPAEDAGGDWPLAGCPFIAAPILLWDNQLGVVQACNPRRGRAFEADGGEVLMGFGTLVSMAVRDAAMQENTDAWKGAVDQALEAIAQMEEVPE